MHPVEPRTMVRGPAALTINFMTRADTQPWQVRWPEVKYSSRVTFFTPLKGERTCVSLRKVAVSAIIGLRFRSSIWSRRLWPADRPGTACGLRATSLPSSFAHAQPVGAALGSAGLGRRGTDVRRLVDVLQGDLAPAEAADEADEGRPVLRIVEGRADLVGDHPGSERAPEGVITVDDPDGLGPPEGPG